MLVEPRRKGKHFTKDERAKIEALYHAGLTHKKIAEIIGCTRPAISIELKRGQVEHLDGDTYIISKTYDAYAAQIRAEYMYTAHSKGLKLGNNHAYANAISECIKMGYSPYSAIHRVGMYYGIMVSKQTMYRYIKEGLIPDVTYKKLPVGHPKKRKGTINTYRPMRSKSVKHRSIERRPKAVNRRDSLGHWEIDSIVGKQEGKKESCLVITERMTLEEVVLKVDDKTAQSTTIAMQTLKNDLGEDFNLIFQTLTGDNGTEFADQESFDALGLTMFYCHPHAPHERGSNENSNKLLRRHFPKGESMADKTQYHATQAQHFVNTYPREKFNGRCSNDLFKEQLQKLPLKNPQRVYNYFNIF